MKRVYLLDICEKNGLFYYNREEKLEKRLSETYEVVCSETENLGTLDDVTVGIVDEEPEFVVIRISPNCSQFLYAAAVRLIEEGISSLLFLSARIKEPGIVKIENTACLVSEPGNPVFEREEKWNEYRIGEVFDDRICYGEEAVPVLENGVSAWITGSYPDPEKQSGLKHLFLDGLEEGNLPEFSPELFDGNSALIFPDFRNGRFDALKQTERGIYMHVHQRKNDGISLDNTGVQSRMRVQKYAEADGTLPVYLKIEDWEDLEALLADVRSFTETGYLPKLGARFVNECAWGISPCILSGLLRGRTDRDKKLYPCHGCSRSVGTVEDDGFELARAASILMRTERETRGCASCEKAAVCSRCAMLPDGLSAEEYCRAVRTPGTMDYLFKTIMAGGIIGESREIRKLEPAGIEVSSPSRRLAAQKADLEGGSASGKRSILMALRSGTDYYVLGYKMSRLYRTDERFVYLAEMFDAAVPTEQIVFRYADRFGLDKKEAGAHITEAYDMLKNAVII